MRPTGTMDSVGGVAGSAFEVPATEVVDRSEPVPEICAPEICTPEICTVR